MKTSIPNHFCSKSYSLNSEVCVDYDLQRPFLWYNGEGKNSKGRNALFP
jgi:hypothetical protein